MKVVGQFSWINSTPAKRVTIVLIFELLVRRQKLAQVHTVKTGPCQTSNPDKMVLVPTMFFPVHHTPVSVSKGQESSQQ